MKNIVINSLIFAIILLLSGCGNDTPKCSDAQTVKLVNSIYDKQMSYIKQLNLNFTISLDETTIRTISEDDKTGLYTCQGDILANSNMDKEVFGMLKKSLEKTITYTVVMGDDKKSFFVNIIK